MNQANNLGEASAWFLSHATGQLECRDGSREKICNSYTEAEQFFYHEDSDTSSKPDEDFPLLGDLTSPGLDPAADDSGGQTIETPDITSDPDPSTFESGGGDFGGGGGGSDW